MRGQSAVELVILLAFNIVLILLFLTAIAPVEERIAFERRQVLAKEVLTIVAAEVDGAALVGDGYGRRLTIPERLRDNSNFTLHISPEIQRLMIVWGESEGAATVKILTSNVSGNFTHGPHVIRNVRGVVVVEEA